MSNLMKAPRTKPPFVTAILTATLVVCLGTAVGVSVATPDSQSGTESVIDESVAETPGIDGPENESVSEDETRTGEDDVEPWPLWMLSVIVFLAGGIGLAFVALWQHRRDERRE